GRDVSLPVVPACHRQDPRNRRRIAPSPADPPPLVSPADYAGSPLGALPTPENRDGVLLLPLRGGDHPPSPRHGEAHARSRRLAGGTRVEATRHGRGEACRLRRSDVGSRSFAGPASSRTHLAHGVLVRHGVGAAEPERGVGGAATRDPRPLSRAAIADATYDGPVQAAGVHDSHPGNPPRGSARLKPYRSERMTSIETYMYGLKARAHRHHCLAYGTFPVDLTRLTRLRRVYSRQIRPVTLLPFFIKAVALAVRRTPDVNRILFRRFPFGRCIVRFDDVDVNVPITRVVDGETTTFIGTIRGADCLSVAAIQDTLAHLQRGSPAKSPDIQKIRRLRRAPSFVASLFHWLMSRSPRFYLKNAGTCSLTTLDGMRGDYFLAIGPTTSLFSVGGIGDEPIVRNGAVVVRRVLKAALAVDNYVVTGLQGVALARTFQELLESGS